MDNGEVIPGSTIGHYVVVEPIGSGGMGQVFLCHDPRLRRRVALKCLFASPSGADLRARILHEARAAARINHPNIAIVHDVIEHESRAFLVMEYVEGETLAHRLRRGQLPIAEALTISAQLAAALAAAHEKGIIHRDLKPANVQVMRAGVVKILDFGVAQAVSLLSTDSTGTTTSRDQQTRHDALAGQPGTPAYMSPEQRLGRPVDERTDIYSLGVMLFEMTTGRRPYSGSDPLDGIIAMSRVAIRADAVDRTVPVDVSDAIAKAMDLRPEGRFQTAAAFGVALAALQKAHGPTTPTVALPTRPPVSRAHTFLRALTWVVAVPLVITLLGALSTVAFNHTFGRTPPFNREPPTAWFVFGLRSIVAPAVYMTAVVVALYAVQFIVRVLRLSRRFDQLLTTTFVRTENLSSRLGMDDPIGFAQAMSTFGALAIAAVLWRFSDVLAASASFISTAPARTLRPLSPSYSKEAALYRFALDVLLLVFAAGLLRMRQLRRRHGVRHGVGANALVFAIFTMIVLLDEAPYRILWKNEFEKVDVEGTRCYITGEHDPDLLLFCPDVPPPRNRVLKRDDSAIHRLGVVESVFMPAKRGSP